MSQFVSFALLFFSIICFGQSRSPAAKKPLTSKYAGVYGYGRNADKESVGSVIVYPETDSTILFYIDLCRGAPSYNLGIKYGRMKITNDTGSYYNGSSSYEGKGCKWYFEFSEKSLTINSVDGQNECGFGHAVFADGIYKRRSSKLRKSFIDMTGDTIYFRMTPPEKYSK